MRDTIVAPLAKGEGSNARGSSGQTMVLETRRGIFEEEDGN